MPQVVIANRLTDGRIVFLAESDRWASSVNDARVEEPGDAANALLDAGLKLQTQNQVIDAALIDVTVDGGQVHPTKPREAIRANGPTTRPDLGKQAGNE